MDQRADGVKFGAARVVGTRADVKFGANDIAQVVRADGDVLNEPAMRAISAVLGAFAGLAQIALHKLRIHAIEKRAVVEDGVAATALGIAGDFATADGEVGNALVGGKHALGAQGIGDSPEDVAV